MNKIKKNNIKRELSKAAQRSRKQKYTRSMEDSGIIIIIIATDGLVWLDFCSLVLSLLCCFHIEIEQS